MYKKFLIPLFLITEKMNLMHNLYFLKNKTKIVSKSYILNQNKSM